jgi:putative serine protease PepD
MRSATCGERGLPFRVPDMSPSGPAGCRDTRSPRRQVVAIPRLFPDMPGPVITTLQRYKRLLPPLLAAIAAGAAVAGVSLATDETPTPSSSPTTALTTRLSGAVREGLSLQNAFVRVVRSVSPSVVQIEDQRGLGSGVVLDAAGHVVTNNHVVTGASSFTVTTSNGKRYRATLVGAFPPDDLAVIKAQGAHLVPATFADSAKLHVGDLAIAIGNPLGLRSSATQGIVSAFRQAVQEPGGATLPSVIQTSAAINPGNSGGALVDIQGRVIGIPTLAATDPELGGSAPGIGFAIPSNLVKDIAGQILAHGRVVDSHRAFLGIRVGEAAANGVIVVSVTRGGAAANAGIRVGDMILSIKGASTPTVGALAAVLAELKPGEKARVVVRHQRYEDDPQRHARDVPGG